MSHQLIAVTACTAGVAHTFMAAEGLRKAAAKMGVDIHVETQGTTGIENRITPELAASAEAIIYAHDVAIRDIERFEGIPVVDVATVAAIKDAESLIEQAPACGRDVSAPATPDAAETAPAAASAAASAPAKPGFPMLVRDAVLSGISYIIPVIIAGGMISAIATILAQSFGLQELLNDSTSWLSLFKSLGSGALGTLMVPILSAYMSFALADKPGLAPGFIGGLANIGLSVPGAGIFSLIALSGPLGPVMSGVVWVGAALVGAAISTVLLIVTRKRQLAKQAA